MLAMLQRFEDGEEETDDSDDEEAGEVDLATRMKVRVMRVWIKKSLYVSMKMLFLTRYIAPYSAI